MPWPAWLAAVGSVGAGRARACDRCGRGLRGGRFPLFDPRLHAAVHRPSRLQLDGRARTLRVLPWHRVLVRRGNADRRRPYLRAADPALRPRGTWAWRSGGDVCRVGARRQDPPPGRRGQVARVRGLHRLGWLGRPGGADRADRLCAWLYPRSVDANAGVAAEDFGRLRRRRRSGRRSTPRSPACSSHSS